MERGRALTSHGCDPYVASAPPTTLRDWTIGFHTWGAPHFEADGQDIRHVSVSTAMNEESMQNKKSGLLLFGIHPVTHLFEQHRCQCWPKTRERAERHRSSSPTHTSRLSPTKETNWFIDPDVCEETLIHQAVKVLQREVGALKSPNEMNCSYPLSKSVGPLKVSRGEVCVWSFVAKAQPSCCKTFKEEKQS